MKHFSTIMKRAFAGLIAMAMIATATPNTAFAAQDVNDAGDPVVVSSAEEPVVINDAAAAEPDAEEATEQAAEEPDVPEEATDPDAELLNGDTYDVTIRWDENASAEIVAPDALAGDYNVGTPLSVEDGTELTFRVNPNHKCWGVTKVMYGADEHSADTELVANADG
ncbi:MAG: hypothetical protein K6D90_11495, partial [Lachnospiraceae bacterium]|nr:hypothetical protein [Lachnospiraceae bacterium]